MCPRPRCRRPGAEDPGLPRGRPLLARGHLLAALPAIPLLHSPGRPHRRTSPRGVVVEAHQRPPRVAARERLATAGGGGGGGGGRGGRGGGGGRGRACRAAPRGGFPRKASRKRERARVLGLSWR